MSLPPFNCVLFDGHVCGCWLSFVGVGACSCALHVVCDLGAGMGGLFVCGWFMSKLFGGRLIMSWDVICRHSGAVLSIVCSLLVRCNGARWVKYSPLSFTVV